MNWNDHLFDCLSRVNRSLHSFLPVNERAKALLSDMEGCLCSGDGLSARSAFRAADPVVADRVLGMLGVRESVSGQRREDGCTLYTLSENPFGVGSVYFTLRG